MTQQKFTQLKFFDYYKEEKPHFARHENYPPRHGWLVKGYRAARQDALIFSQDPVTIMVRLGMTKRMANALKFWCKAFKLLEEDEGGAMISTKFGADLLGTDGLDCYLESHGAWWLLHWKLLQPPCYAPMWAFVFRHFGKVSFTASDLVARSEDYCKERNWKVPATSTLSKDVACLLRMYVPPEVNPLRLEEDFDTPFSELRLLLNTGSDFRFSERRRSLKEEDEYRFNYNRPVPATMLVYASLDFLMSQGSRTTCNVSHLLYRDNSPGIIFKVGESALLEAIEAIAKNHKEISWSQSGGIVNFSCSGSPQEVKERLLLEALRY